MLTICRRALYAARLLPRLVSVRSLHQDSTDPPHPSTVDASYLLQEKVLEQFSTNADPADTSILLFPGQGSQHVGMAADLVRYPNVKEMFNIASDILNFDLLAYCQHGPQSELDRTIHCQPAIMVTSLAGVEKIQVTIPEVLESCVACAGYSVGEFAALVFAGVLTFEDAIRLVGVRARAMQHASDAVPSRMVTAIGGAQTRFNYICQTARDHCAVSLAIENPVCRVSAHLCPNTVTLAGHSAAISFIEEQAKELRIRKIIPISVSGAFHTPLMAPASNDLRDALKRVHLSSPVVHVYSNVTGKRYNGPDQIRKNLPAQVTSPVKWEQITHNLLNRPLDHPMPTIYDTGPGKQLGSLLKHCNGKAGKNYVPLSSL